MLILRKTSIASRAIDDLTDKSSRTEVQEALLKYLDTDTIWLVILLLCGTSQRSGLVSTKIIHHGLNNCRPNIGTRCLPGHEQILTLS
jgi:hypothetical protein